MTRILSGALLLSALALSPAASADSWFASWQVGHFDRHSGGHRDYGRSFSRHYSPRHTFQRHYSPRNSRAYGRGYRHGYRDGSRHDYHGGRFTHRSVGRYRHDHSDGVALLGGVVLGSLLSSSLRNDYGPTVVRHETVSYRSRPVVRTTRALGGGATGLRSTVGRQAVLQQGVSRRLLKDLQGDCFEIVRAAGGTELRRQLPAEACQF